YFDIVEWGQHFFQLFEELRDERVETEELRSINDNPNINLLEWQEKYLTRVLDIHDRYRDLLKKLNFTDPIFYHRASGIRVPFQGYKMVFVNQYYYSKLEKALIKALEDAGNEIVIITQSPGDKTGIEDLKAPGLGLENLTRADIRTTGIEIVECENEDQMVLAFLAEHAPANEPFSGNGVVLDRQFHNKHYKDLFDPAQFKIPPSESIVRTGLHAFLKILHEHLVALNASQDGGFVPLRMLVSACSQPNFLRYYQPGWGKTERDALLSEFRRLFEQDILYVDKELSLFQILDHKQPFALLPQILIPHFALLEKLSQVRRPAGLIDLIDIGDGLRIKEMCSEQELLYSDILEQFYERLANFASLEKLGIVDDWPGLFGERTNDLGANILWLFLEALSGARVSHKALATADEGKFEISNLLDLRNLSYDTVAFFHAIEGEYPKNPEPVWLFNESQRKAIGLKDYPTLRDRDRYYFFRQVFTSQKVLIYCYRNMEKDIEPGSFVTELIHIVNSKTLLGDKLAPVLVKPEISILYPREGVEALGDAEATVSQDSDLWDPKNDPQEEFFVLPPDPVHDFGPQHQLKLSYQSISRLVKNPFAWYVQYFRRIKEIDPRPEETISRKLFGALMHGFLGRVLNDLGEAHDDVHELAPVMDSTEELSRYLQELINSSIYLFKLPQNYNHAFLVSIMADCLSASVRDFYRKFLIPNLEGRRFDLIPEKDHMTREEREYKKLASQVLDEAEYEMLIHGKADLRIHTSKKNYIVDFKTGSHDREQLLFYEWFYYLLDEGYDGREIVSRFWMILDRKPEEKTDEKKRENWRANMQQVLAERLQSGYPLAGTVTNRRILQNITRGDLYRVPSGGEE
ncbi:MAG: PD-(D/E)XK nuclease family protein, partial [Candidatus Syntrophosphaera sp.]